MFIYLFHILIWWFHHLQFGNLILSLTFLMCLCDYAILDEFHYLEWELWFRISSVGILYLKRFSPENICFIQILVGNPAWDCILLHFYFHILMQKCMISWYKYVNMRLRLGKVCFSFSFFLFSSTESQLWTKSGRHAFLGIVFVYFLACFPNSLTKHVILLGYLLYLRILSWYYFFRAGSYSFSWSFNPQVWPLKIDRWFSAKCYFY